MIVFKFSMLISLLQSNQVYYTESGEKCQSECDWSELSNGSSFVRNCLNINETRSRCSLLKSMFDIFLKLKGKNKFDKRKEQFLKKKK